MTEGLGVRPREHDDLDTRLVQELRKHLVVEPPVRMEPGRGPVLELTEMVNLDRRVRERISKLVGDPEALLRPAPTDECESEGFVGDQALVDLAPGPVDVDDRAMRNDLNAFRVDVVNAQEVVGGTLACEYPSVDRFQTRRRRSPKPREVGQGQVPGFGEAPLAEGEVLGNPAGLSVPIEKRVVRAREI